MKEKWRKLQKIGNKGLSFVELLCAVAILATVSTAIGGILVVSANSYKNADNEVDMQQEAQLVVNQVADMIIDTTFEDDEGIVFDSNKLTILQKGDKHVVTFDPAAKTLSYQCVYKAGGVSDTQLMAEGVYNFYADATGFKDSGNLYLDIGIEREDKKFDAAFNVTSRNGIVDTEPTVSIDVISDVVLEPNQTYQFHPTVNGISNQNVSWEIVSGNTTADTKMVADNTILIGRDEYGSDIYLMCRTQAKDASGNPFAIKPVRVRIRRVTGITVSGGLTSGTACKSGALYSGTIVLNGTYLDKEVGQPYDDTDYVDPYQIDTTVLYEGFTSGPAVNFTKSPIMPNKWRFSFTLTEDMAVGQKITVKATARHPMGTDGAGTFTNKTGKKYNTLSGEYSLTKSWWNIYSKMERASDLEFGTLDITSLKAKIAKDLGCGDGEFTIKRHYRSRPASSTSDADWTEWYEGGDNGSSINVRTDFGKKMNCLIRYTVEIEIYAINNNTQKRVWPIDGVTPKDEYLYIGEVEPVGAIFSSSYLNFTKKLGWTKSDAASAPKINKDNTNFNIIEVKEWRAIKQQDYQNFLIFKLYKEEGTEWKEVSDAIQNQGGACMIKKLNGGGRYKVEVGLANDELTPQSFMFKQIDGSEGVFYFEAQ